MKVSIIGCGNIGSQLASFIDGQKEFTLFSLTDINQKNIHHTLSKIKNNQPKILSLHGAIIEADLIIESACKEVVKEILVIIDKLKINKKLLVMSTGGLIENMDLLDKIKICEIYVPSGAIAGLDAIKAVAGNIDSLTLTTTKPWRSLEGSPYVMENKIQLHAIKKKKMIFHAGLKDAIRGFPQNINVAASLFLASRFDDIKIKIIADPHIKVNRHEIICEGAFGRIRTITENLPSRNPKTSYLAIQSARAVLQGIINKIKIGN